MRDKYLITDYPNFFLSEKAVIIYNNSINAMFDKIGDEKDLTITMKIRRRLLIIYLTCIDSFLYKIEKNNKV